MIQEDKARRQQLMCSLLIIYQGTAKLSQGQRLLMTMEVLTDVESNSLTRGNIITSYVQK